MKSEFAISEVLPGKLNAMVKNIMGQMKIDDPNEAVRRVNAGEWVVSRVVKSILRLISGSKEIVISATAGGRTIAEAKGIFTGGIDRDFVNWDLNTPNEARPKTPVEVHEMVEDDNFKAIFDSFNRSLDDLCFTQDQIITFIEDHKDWLRRNGYGTFFLMKKNGKFFVVYVTLDSDERPHAFVYHLSNAYLWSADYRRRVVVPQLALES
ncbi:MAG: hypothetical protein JW740_01055 [Candidatus Zambryskibacteria bacterium]|nr:hypothetical protein [Candidatus Zambryskibacteria bacterium]